MAIISQNITLLAPYNTPKQLPSVLNNILLPKGSYDSPPIKLLLLCSKVVKTQIFKTLIL
jgi:hypothetical protein